ncbi:MAG: hypothetical protein K2G82_06975, partial [Paramuribaculum sp.]|nr:hypothetical protein [Paramuribaculum sp.]
MDKAETARKHLKETIAAQTERLTKELADIDGRLSDADTKLKTDDIDRLQRASADAHRDITLLKEGIANRQRHGQTAAMLLNDRKRYDELTARMADITKELELLTPQIEQTEKSATSLRDDITLLRSTDLEHQRSRLEDGKACPLCGSTRHPYAKDNVLTPVIDHLSTELSERLKSLEQLREHLRLLGNESGRIEGETVQLEKRTAENRRISDELQAQWEIIASQKPEWPDTAVSLGAMLSGYEQAQTEADRRLSAYNALRQLADRLQADKDRTTASIIAHQTKAEADTAKADEECQKLNTAIQTATERSAALQKSLDEKQTRHDTACKEVEQVKTEIAATEARIRQEIGDTDPETLQQSLTRATEDAKNEMAARTAALNEKQTGIELAKGRLTQTRSQISAESESIATAEQKLGTIIADLNEVNLTMTNIDRETIAEISRWDDDWENCRKEVNQCRQTVAATQATLSEKHSEKEKHQQLRPENDENALHDNLARLSAYSTDELDRNRLRIQ